MATSTAKASTERKRTSEQTLDLELARDITQTKQAEAALRQSEELFRLVADTAPVLIWMSGTDKLCTCFNKPWLDFTGRPIEQELGNGWAEGVHPEDLQRCLDTYTRSFELREKLEMEYRLRRHDGEYRWIFDTGVPRYREDGSFAGYIGSCVDVTERKRAEEARFRHAAVVESTEDAIISKDLDANIVSWNAGAERLFGYTELEAVGQPITILIPPELRDEENQIFERLRAGGRIEHYETTRISKTGKRIDVSLSIGPIKDSNGSIVGFSKIAHDITSRKNAERALAESEERLLLATRVARMFAYSWDATTDIIQRSGESAEILGVDPDVANTGAAVSAMVHPDDREKVDAAFAKLTVENPILQISYRIVRPDGGITWLERNSHAYFDEHGKLSRIIGMVRDITQQKKSEEALLAMTRKLIDGQEQERTRIARELHDDVNQQLALLAVEMDLWDQRTPDNPAVHDFVQEAKQRISGIAHDVQSLSHQLHSSKLEYLGLATAAKSLCAQLAQKSGAQIDFSQDGVSRRLPSEVSLALYRILQEALHNAVEHSGTKNIEVRLWAQSNELHLIVKDSGNGFDPLAVTQGSGLGLTSMRERVRLVNGNIAIDSKPGHGTTIHVSVPLPATASLLRISGHSHEELEGRYVAFVDEERRYLDVTDGVCELLGYSRSELLKMRIDDVTAPLVRSNTASLFREYLADGLQRGSYILLHRNGNTIPITYTAKVFPDGCLVARWEPQPYGLDSCRRCPRCFGCSRILVVGDQ